MALAPDDSRHGTANGYRRHGCRCDACRRAHATAMQAYRDAHRDEVNAAARDYTRRNFPKVQQWGRVARTAHERGTTTAEHGTRSRYNVGCRCRPCRDSEAAYMRERRRAS